MPTKKVEKVKKVVKKVKKVVKKKPLMPGVTGKGGYFSDLGTSLGAKAGKYLGGLAGNSLDEVFGMGSYSVSRNALLGNNGAAGPPPTFKTETDGSVVLCMREFVSDITGSTTFTNFLSQPINPANPILFPRLSQIAPNWEEYDFEGLIFDYNTTSGTAVGSTNTALGTVIMATNYDVLDPVFTTKQQMESYMFSTSIVPCASIIHPVECAPHKRLANENLYVVPTSGFVGGASLNTTVSPFTLPANSDARLYHMGNFQLSTVGMQAANVVGELWVSYCIRLKVPKLATTEQALHVYSATNAGGSSPLGFANISAGSNMPAVTTATTITINTPGYYQLTSLLKSTAANLTGNTGITFSSGSTQVNAWGGYGLGQFAGLDASDQSAVNVIYFKLTASTVFTFTSPTGMTAGSADVFITPMPSVPPF